MQEEQSFYERGKVIASALVSISDDAADPAGTPASFDYEGVATQRVTLLEAGVCRELVHDNQTAARAGRPLDRPRPAGPQPMGPVPAAPVHGAPARHPATRSSEASSGACW